MNKSLNTFRTFAFIAVFLFHADGNLFSFGYLGVLAFFVLSGYLITPILISTKEKASSFSVFLKNFYGRRALRIFPLYYLYLILLAGLVLAKGYKPDSYFSPIVNDLPYTLTYTYNFHHLSNSFQHCKFISHVWSLAVEEQFYLLWPIAVYFLNNKSIKAFLLSAVIAGPFIRLVSFYLFTNCQNHFTEPDTAVYVSTFSHIDAFLTGGYAALYGQKLVLKNSQLYLLLATILTVGITTNVLNINHTYLTSLGYQHFMPDSYKFVWGYTTWSIFFALVLVRLHNRNFLSTLFENPGLSYLGKISYGLYIYHYPILHLIKSYCPFPGAVIQTAASFALTVLISGLSFKFYESRFLRLKDRFFPIR